MHKYTDKDKLNEAINFFDADGDGQINAAELESMLQSFSKTESNYADDAEVTKMVEHWKKNKKADQL